MRIRVVAVGRLKEAHWRAAADEYLRRLTPYATIEVTEVSDRDLGGDEGRAVAAEGADVLKALPADAHVIALDMGGPLRTSENFAARLGTLMLDGRSDIAFVVGGAAGHSPDVLARSDERLSLSAMTLPHQLARVVLLEQVYRAFRIMRGEPYHR